MKVQSFQKGQSIVAVLFLFAALWLVVFPIKDYDTFWHLANGKAMLEQGRIINEEIFSYSAVGTEFENHSWLAQIIMALFYRAGGLNGLLVFKLFLTGGLFAVIYRTSRHFAVSPLLAGMASYGVVLVGLSRFVVRPQLFSYLFLAILIFILNGYLKRKWGWQVLIALPLLTVIWDFMHGAIFGFVFWGFLAVSETLKLLMKGGLRRWQEPFVPHKEQVLHLWSWLAISLLIAMLIPGGFERYYNLFVALWGGANTIFGITGEFMPTGWDVMFRPFWLLLGMTALGALINWRRLDLSHLMVLIPFVYLGIRYNRCVAVFAVVAAPLFVHHLQQLCNSMVSGSLARRLAQAMVLVLCVVSLSWGTYLKGLPLKAGELDPSGFRTGTGLNKAFLPIGMVKFIKAANLTGICTTMIAGEACWCFTFTRKGLFFITTIHLCSKTFTSICTVRKPVTSGSIITL